MQILETACGKIAGIEKDDCNVFLGVPYAHAKRFEYAEPVTSWENEYNNDGFFYANQLGKACPQMRTYHEHLEIAERQFYHKEFREGLPFDYDEDCLNLNIWTPKNAGAGSNFPVMIFIHGGGFDSGTNTESPFDGSCYAKRGIICIFINYRVGIFGYLTHPSIQAKFDRNGNFGLDDQLTAIMWVKKNISSFGGDPENITLAGQSAGAISIQYLCLNHQNEGLFKNVIMISGGGKFPDFALPRPAEQNCTYWQDFLNFMENDSGSKIDFEVLKTMDAKIIFDMLDKFKPTRKDNTYNTMPVIDGILITSPIQRLIKNPLKINYMLGYTNCDLYAPLMALIGHKFARANNGYVYFFDVNPKGDDGRKAFHSSDLRFILGTLEKSWRPYDDEDKKIANLIQEYIAAFVKTGNPNSSKTLPLWKVGGKKALHFTTGKIKMVKPPYLRLIYNMLSGGKQI